MSQYELPAFAQAALARLVAGQTGKRLQQASQALSQSYRGKQPGRHLGESGSIEAYLATRLPATFAVVAHVLAELKLRNPGFAPLSLLDLGAGPGTASLAAAHLFPTLTQLTLIERERSMIAAGQSLFKDGPPSLARADWRQGALPLSPTPTADLSLVSYVINELPPLKRGLLIDDLLALDTTLVVIEPGTPEGYGHILALRSQAIAAGWRIWAPCPHHATCPLADGDWCHFSQRLARSSLHRSLKQGSQSYEDEKFAYLVLAKSPVPLPAGRILRHPDIRKGHLELRLCADTGQTRAQVVSKSEASYKAARKAKWGDAWGETRID